MRTPSLLLIVAASALAGCGGGQQSAGTDEAVAIQDFEFAPAGVTVKAGTTVRFTNEDAAPHTATADDGSFDTGDLRKGGRGSATLQEPGTYGYFCEFHKFMRAKITVVG